MRLITVSEGRRLADMLGPRPGRSGVTADSFLKALYRRFLCNYDLVSQLKTRTDRSPLKTSTVTFFTVSLLRKTIPFQPATLFGTNLSRCHFK